MHEIAALDILKVCTCSLKHCRSTNMSGGTQSIVCRCVSWGNIRDGHLLNEILRAKAVAVVTSSELIRRVATSAKQEYSVNNLSNSFISPAVLSARDVDVYMQTQYCVGTESCAILHF